MKKSTLSLILGATFLIAVLVAFIWVWYDASNNQSSSYDLTAVEATVYQPVDISGISEKAKDLVAGKQNLTPLPIPIPEGKMGVEDPFSI